jgi:hypothetical protein
MYTVITEWYLSKSQVHMSCTNLISGCGLWQKHFPSVSECLVVSRLKVTDFFIHVAVDTGTFSHQTYTTHPVESQRWFGADDWIELNLFHRGNISRPRGPKSSRSFREGSQPPTFPNDSGSFEAGRTAEWASMMDDYAAYIGTASLSVCPSVCSLSVRRQVREWCEMWEIVKVKRREEEVQEVEVKERFRLTIND